MMLSDYWGALSSRQRIGLGTGAAVIVAGTLAFAAWALRDPYVPLAADLSGERLRELTHELDGAKLRYAIDESGSGVTVPQSQLGKARAATAGGQFGAPPSVGLELFKETDFSTTDFAQRINYQRALQGELTRTIQTINGVRNARVHVILAEGGVLKRNAAKASAAVSVAMQPGAELALSQVRGIQRLVAASVPDIKIEDVVVLDEWGTSLTRAVGREGESDLSSAQLDLKRQADQYLQDKLSRLLKDLVPHGIASLSVDTTLDYNQLSVTTEQPIATPGSVENGQPAGVLVKQRHSQRGRGAGVVEADYDGNSSSESDSTDEEYEYKVGHRMEQTLSTPGSIKRVSVAVALQGVPAELPPGAIEELVAHAVGIDRSRGDSVAVLLLPAPAALQEKEVELPTAPRAPEQPRPAQPRVQAPSTGWVIAALGPSLAESRRTYWAAGTLAALLVLWVAMRYRTRARRARAANSIDVDATAAKVRQWLNEGAGNGRV